MTLTATAPAYLTNAEPGLARGWHPVARTVELGCWTDGPMPVDLLGTQWAVMRGGDGAVQAWGREGEPYATVEHLGLIWIAPLEPVTGLLDAPEVSDPAYAAGWLPTGEFATAASLMLDNQLDASHFPYVHAGTFGNNAAPEVPAYEITRTPGGFLADVVHAFKNVNDPAVVAGVRPVEQRRRVSYRFALPMQLQLRIEHLETGQHTVIFFGLQPARIGHTRFFTQILRDDLPGWPAATAALTLPATLAFEERVVAEDIVLQNAFTIPGLPLDLRMEMAVRADRSGLELRRMLAAMCGG
jgi:phenylpropionate dioxygenase-like ring-hydroxylating dioxygenase large terminal subunit